MTEEQELFDITIIGGGPTGLFTTFYAGMRQMKVKIIESLPQLGGQLSTLYPEKEIFDVAGFPKIKAKDLVKNLTVQAEQFHPDVVLDEAISSMVRREDGVIELIGASGRAHRTKTIVITAGVGAFAPRPLKVDQSVEKFTNIHYYVQDVTIFKKRRVVILGGGDSAVDWANTLAPIAKSVTIIHRRDQFRAHETSVEAMKKASVQIKTPFIAKSVSGSQDRIDQLTIQMVKGETEETLPLDDLIVNYGFVSALGPIKDWGLELEKNSILVNSKMETNIPGVYAAGDIAAYPGKIKLIATGLGEAPTAVNNAKHYLDPKSRAQPVHSSSAGELFAK
ncbi:NAD(P)/FAD-dependent oxidoreductase [Sporolactobacillus shoreicorticis]|uniref:Ferredoxin--NADP reductase n=1 Tax=Sporolactobacillus shoreicorticis TaxID=1923877 RepID=A0ABW5S6F2_9BACL|nr:NAD(P)/FAD-dependent oxidoreductase [Sporolactobacillus shoreicorticis]MCO7125741.1 NAD(P)/FAD-dependent oxidoreductase [Sporolactobacillus shoreicorticis]